MGTIKESSLVDRLDPFICYQSIREWFIIYPELEYLFYLALFDPNFNLKTLIITSCSSFYVRVLFSGEADESFSDYSCI